MATLGIFHRGLASFDGIGDVIQLLDQYILTLLVQFPGLPTHTGLHLLGFGFDL